MPEQVLKSDEMSSGKLLSSMLGRYSYVTDYQRGSTGIVVLTFRLWRVHAFTVSFLVAWHSARFSYTFMVKVVFQKRAVPHVNPSSWN